jgi:DNA-binding LytR/AlgR family response regulator
MNIIAVDDDRLALDGLKNAIEKAMPETTLVCFNSPKKALEYAQINHIHIAFLDIEMGSMNGLHLAKYLKKINEKIKIVFVTAHSQYAVDAFALKASGFILKPVTAEAVREAVGNSEQ